MFSRITAVFIVLFWLTMTALLVHQEVRPGDSALREIPVAHVIKLFFMHRQEDQPQVLVISSGKPTLGHLRLIPKTDEKTQSHDLRFNGEVSIVGLTGKRERVGWEGEWKMDKLLTTSGFKLAVKTHVPTDLTTQIEVLPEENAAYYEVIASNGTIAKDRYTLDENGIRSALQDIGIDSSLFAFAEKQEAATPLTIKARLSTLRVYDEDMDTYLVTIDLNGQNLLSCHVDQLGHVLRVNTLLGYTLSAEDH